MKKIISILSILFILLPLYGQKKDIISYFPSWKWQDRNRLVTPQSIPYEKLTGINYCFFYPLESGELVGMDPQADTYFLKGETDSLSGQIKPNSSLIDLAHRQGVKVMLVLGGWDNSGNFPGVSADPVKRARLAHWCNKYIKEYGFDGIDVDWEFPGYVRHKGTPQDKFNFTLLLQTIRDSLDVLGAKTGKRYGLSVSLPAAESHTLDMEVPAIGNIVDFMNIMIYDLYGPWGKISNHNSALYAPVQGDPGRCLDGAFRLYHQKLGVPANKINLAIPSYGHAYANCTAMYSAHGGADTTYFPENDGVNFYQIHEHLNEFKRYWDEKAQVPYLINEKEKILVSFDDVESVAVKADYIIKNGARGIVLWHLLGDYLPDGRTPLLEAVYSKFK